MLFCTFFYVQPKHQNGNIFVHMEGFRPCLSTPSYRATEEPLFAFFFGRLHLCVNYAPFCIYWPTYHTIAFINRVTSATLVLIGLTGLFTEMVRQWDHYHTSYDSASSVDHKHASHMFHGSWGGLQPGGGEWGRGSDRARQRRRRAPPRVAQAISCLPPTSWFLNPNVN